MNEHTPDNEEDDDSADPPAEPPPEEKQEPDPAGKKADTGEPQPNQIAPAANRQAGVHN